MKMKVLHLISRYRWTGSAEPAVNLCAYLGGEGVDSRLCCIPGGSLEREARAREVPLVLKADLARNYTPWGILRKARQIARMVRDEKIDLLHTHTSHDHWLSALALSRFSAQSVPLIRTHHETRRIRVGRVWRRIFNDHTAMNVTPSRSSRDYFVESGAMRPEKVETIYGGLDFARFGASEPAPDVRAAWGLPPDSILVAHLSHIGPDRRQRQALEAFALVSQEYPSALLVFLGQGNKSTVRELKASIAGLPIALRVIFSKDHTAAGIAWGDQLAAMNRVLVLAVGSEGSSRGVMEAMALGRPVIGARVGVLPELIEPGVTGWLVDPEQPASIAGALRGSLADPGLAARIGAAGAERIHSHFRCERQARETRELYERIVQERGVRAPQAGLR
jgi:glycosyltransferase involved in cell wall biosynthesis